jgi:hypothetical protein
LWRLPWWVMVLVEPALLSPVWRCRANARLFAVEAIREDYQTAATFLAASRIIDQFIV